jgi:hypothetical protein
VDGGESVTSDEITAEIEALKVKVANLQVAVMHSLIFTSKMTEIAVSIDRERHKVLADEIATYAAAIAKLVEAPTNE